MKYSRNRVGRVLATLQKYFPPMPAGVDFVGGVLLIVAMTGCEEAPDAPAKTREGRLPAVEVVQAEMGRLTLSETLNATVSARNQTTIFPQISGPITEVLVDEGDAVSQGQLLVRIRDTEFRERLLQAEAETDIAAALVNQTRAKLKRLQTQDERVRNLWHKGLVSELERENAELAVESAAADLEMALAQERRAQALAGEARNTLDHSEVKAPIDGVVGLRNAEIGQYVSPSTALFQIGDLTRMRLSIKLTEPMLERLQSDSYIVIPDENNQLEQRNKKLSRIRPFLNPLTHTTQAEIEIVTSGTKLRPGMFIDVKLVYGETENATLIPNSAVYRHPKSSAEGVFVVQKDPATNFETGSNFQSTVEFIPVTKIAQNDEISAVRDIADGDWVVTIGHHLLNSRLSQKVMAHVSDWDSILKLQSLKNRDLLKTVLEKPRIANSAVKNAPTEAKSN